MLGDDGEELGHASERWFVEREFHARGLVQAARCGRAIVKMFAMAGLLPHVRAWSSNPPLPMLPARPEPSPSRPLDTRAEAPVRIFHKHWKLLAHEGSGRIAAACGAALTPNGSASW